MGKKCVDIKSKCTGEGGYGWNRLKCERVGMVQIMWGTGYDWFGPSGSFKCHCTTECDAEGFCLFNGTCASGWFGLRCQYQNIVTKGSFQPSQYYSMLSDGDNTTCINDSSLQSVNVTWEKPYPFTWMRLTLTDDWSTADLNLNIIFKEADSSEDVACLSKKLLRIDSNTVDIHCKQSNANQQFTLAGDFVGSICELYISGGRNVALKGTAEQPSTHSTCVAGLAVDGNVETIVSSCAHTADSDFYPYWKVQMNSSFAVNRYVILNRDDDCYSRCRKRIDYFVLNALNSKDEVLFSYKDRDANAQLLYMINDVSNSIISQVNISQRHIAEQDNNPYLTLCEVEIYGDCPNGFWGLDCTDRCDTKCSDSCIVDSGWCPIQMNSNPPACNTTCPNNYWGNNCTSVCDGHCLNGSCDTQTGTCTNGCSDGYMMPGCTHSCEQGLYGNNCSLNCSSICTDMKCNAVDGSCISCSPGFQGKFCAESCANRFWGNNCTSLCNVHCLNGLCDAQTGACTDGCEDGYQSPECTKTCDKYEFGTNCSYLCSNYCFTGTCKPESGECYSCIQGYNGAYCNISYEADSTDEHSWQKYFGIGVCVGVLSLLAVQAVICVSVYLRRRWSSKKKCKLQVYNQPDIFNVDSHEYETTYRLELRDDKVYEIIGETSVFV
ncbi:hypothetical protein Btru_013957 [Bulinus truncatus]|nr:hypothetical protein Btru_013957 [Bulinus truncatus]